MQDSQTSVALTGTMVAAASPTPTVTAHTRGRAWRPVPGWALMG